MIDINQYIIGDNINVLSQIEPNSITLCYMDPPFYSNRTLEILMINGIILNHFLIILKIAFV